MSLNGYRKNMSPKREPLMAPTDQKSASKKRPPARKNKPPGSDGGADVDAARIAAKRRSRRKMLKRFLIPAGGFTLAILLTQLNQIADLVEKLFRIAAPHVESNTSVTMTNADYENLFVKVSNAGGKPSTLLDYRLNFGELPIETRTLHPVDSDQLMAVIPAHKDVIMRLTASGLRTRIRNVGQPGRYSKDEIDKVINEQEVTLEIDVRESNDPRSAHLWNLIKPRKSHKAVDSFKATSIRDFILHWLPSHDPK
jgi:hypothetical protein